MKMTASVISSMMLLVAAPAPAMNEMEASLRMLAYAGVGKQLVDCLAHLEKLEIGGAPAASIQGAYDKDPVCTEPRRGYKSAVAGYRSVPGYLRDYLTNNIETMLVFSAYDPEKMLVAINDYLKSVRAGKRPASDQKRREEEEQRRANLMRQQEDELFVKHRKLRSVGPARQCLAEIKAVEETRDYKWEKLWGDENKMRLLKRDVLFRKACSEYRYLDSHSDYHRTSEGLTDEQKAILRDRDTIEKRYEEEKPDPVIDEMRVLVQLLFD